MEQRLCTIFINFCAVDCRIYLNGFSRFYQAKELSSEMLMSAHIGMR